MTATFDLREVSAFLGEPAPGDSTVQHNETFSEWNHIFSDVVHTINKFIGKLNDVGANLPTIPWDDLYKQLVVPLAGDYSLIKQNGNACTILKTGMHAWAGNVDRIAAKTPSLWTGSAASGFGVQMTAYSLAMDGIGEAMSIGTGIFTAMGDVSEHLGVAVENAIVKAATLIKKVAVKVAEKTSGLAGWLSLGYTIAKDGFEYFRDLISEITQAVDLVQACFDLKDEVEGWVSAQQARLQAFLTIPDIMSRLPKVTPHDLATSTVDPTLAKELQDLKTALSSTTDTEAIARLEATIAEIRRITDLES